MASVQEIGTPRQRPEDEPLVRGEARFTDDLRREDALFMAVARSRYGHARLEGIETAAAESVEGVHAVYTAADVRASGRPGVIAPTSTASGLAGVDDPDFPARARTPLHEPERPFLATDRVRYAGEPVAVVLAEDRYTAADAVRHIEPSYERIEAVAHPRAAVEGDAPEVHPDVPGNVAFDWEAGDAESTDAAFDEADHTVSVDIAHQRLVPMAMEPRGALAEVDPATDRLTVYMGTQGPHRARTVIAESLGMAEDRVRVIAPEVGGGFGHKSKFYTDEPLAAWCAIETGRPVRWQANRTEEFQSGIHGRGRTVHGELAIDDDGTIRGLRVESYANLGAYVSRGAPGTRTGSFVDVLSGQYDIPAIHCQVIGCLTTTAPVDSYRGSSRPMTLLTIERLVHLGARELGLDAAEFRRRNFVPPDDFPHETPVGARYDSGEYERALDRALELVGYDELRRRQSARREGERYLGIGLCGAMDNAGTGSAESGRIHVGPSGAVSVFVGTADQGQGHRTTFAQLAADLLGVPFDDIEVREGDTDAVPTGGGASGSRSVVCGGEAIRAAADTITERARPIAAEALEVATEDVRFEDGSFRVAGAPDRSIDLQSVAALADDPDGLEATETTTIDATYPFGTHVAVVSIDPGTGEVDLERYVAVDDAGVPLNPALIEAQVVGGVVQGVGQALFEDGQYSETGTLVNGSLMDYALPRAAVVPDLETDHTVTPSPYNELGVKGAGESGAAAAPAAVANAVADALSPLGIDHVDLPMTPDRVWRAMRAAEGS